MNGAQRLSRRMLLAVAAAAAAGQASALSASPPGNPMTQLSVRPASLDDLDAMTTLLIADAEQRQALTPWLWPVVADARTRIEAAVRPVLDGTAAGPTQLWLVAELGGRLVGVAHALIVPPPPIYDVPEAPGLFLDDCFVTPDAPAGAADALLSAMEDALRARGASTLIASCPARGAWRPLFERQGYEPVTLYMGKDGFEGGAMPDGTRPATADDLPAIVARSAEHRAVLARLNPRFWPTHPEADARFSQWMAYSLTLKDRDMVVAGQAGGVSGYVIAQPVSSLHIPAAHPIAGLGLIDDFHDRELADVAAISNAGVTAAALLSAAERAFVERGVASALVVCPAAWTSKVALLRAAGYRPEKLWMLKR